MSMTPPPMMVRLPTGSRQDKSPSLVRTPGRSRPGMGGTVGMEPVAMRMPRAVTIRSLPESAEPSAHLSSMSRIQTFPGPKMEPCPWTTSTLADLNRERIPPCSWLTT